MSEIHGQKGAMIVLMDFSSPVLAIYSSGCKFMTLQEVLGSRVLGDILGNTLEGNLKIGFVVVVCYCIIT